MRNRVDRPKSRPAALSPGIFFGTLKKEFRVISLEARNVFRWRERYTAEDSAHDECHEDPCL